MRFLTSRGLVDNCCFIALLLHLLDSKLLVDNNGSVQMLESVSSARYSSICNVLCLCLGYPYFESTDSMTV